MTIDTGTISYTVDADTSPLLAAERTVKAHQDKVVNAFGQISKSYDATTGKAKVMTAQMSQTAKGVSKGLANMGRSTGQVGIQLQQLVGQIQGGQNAFQAFGAQAADIGIVMGAPLIGVVAAFAAAIAGTLAPALFDGKTELEKLNEQLELFKKNLKETDKESKDTFTQVEIGKIETEITKTEKSIETLKKSLLELSKGPQSQSTVSQLVGTASQLSDAEEQLKKLTVQRDKLFDAALEEKQLKDVADLTEATDALSLSLKAQIIALRDGEQAAFEYGVAQQLNLAAGEKIPANIQAQIDKIFELRQAQKDQLEQEKKNAELAKSISQFKTKSAADDARNAAKLENDKKGASAFAQGIITRDDDPIQKLANEIEKLDELRANNLLKEEEYKAALVAIDKQANDEIKKSNDELAANELARQNLIFSSVSGLFGAMSDLAKQFKGEQSGEYKALFALSKGFAIATAGLNLSTAISQASILPFPSNIPAMGQALTSGTNLVSAIGSATYTGARANGGETASGGMYRLGEGNSPEVWKTDKGLYGISGDRGQVFNQNQLDQIGGNGGANVQVIIENNASGVEVSQPQVSDDGKIIRMAVNEVANQITRGQGVVAKAMRSSTSAQLKATR